MKSIYLTLLFFVPLMGFTQNEGVGFDGYGKIRLGTSFSQIEKLLQATDKIPDYAWFAPRSYEWYVENWGLTDSSEYFSILAEMEGELNFIPKDPSHKHFLDAPIEALQLSLDLEDKITSITLVINATWVKSNKDSLREKLETLFGTTDCAYSVGCEPWAYYCTWGWDDPSLLNLSDMEEEGGCQGPSIHVTFQAN